MDILTHLAAGAAVSSTLRLRGMDGRPRFDGRVLMSSVIASLVPDLDVLDAPFDGDVGGLAYMLFHRGVTHTVLGCLVIATVIAGTLAFSTQARPRGFGRLWLAAALGAGLHLLMDGSNDYGVHPFWPLDNRWIYGDFIFLSEPLIWAALLPMAIAPLLRDWGARSLNLGIALFAALLPVLIIGFTWWRVAQHQWMTALPALLVTVWVPLQFWGYCRSSSRWLGWGSVAVVWALFYVGSQRARAEAMEWLADRESGERVIQVATTPAPANPLCFRVVSASRDAASGQVITRLGTVSLWPSVISADGCYTPNRTLPPMAVLAPVLDQSPHSNWKWVGEFRGSLSEFESYAKESCRVRLAKAFIRAPFWVQRENGRVIIGDLRLDYAYDLERYCKYLHDPSAPGACPRKADWEPPFFDTTSSDDVPPAATSKPVSRFGLSAPAEQQRELARGKEEP
jgi:inner membrane protein